MPWKDWVPLLAALVSFVGGLLGAWVGSFFAGRTERAKLLRAERLKASADLLDSCRTAVRSWDLIRRLEAGLSNPSITPDPEMFQREAPKRLEQAAAEHNQAASDAWRAYRTLRLLGPSPLVVATRAYWQVYEELVRAKLKDGRLDFDRFRAAEDEFYKAAAAILTK